MRIVVIGAGPGGSDAARKLAGPGREVVVVEQDRPGGTCTNRGCIPTKFLLAAVQRETGGGRSGDRGVAPEAWRKIQARKKALVDGLSRGIGHDLEAAGVRLIRGRAELAGPREVLVEGDGGRERLAADRVVLATGSSPLLVPEFNIDDRLVLTSAAALDLGEVPSSMVIIGSGFIGSEFAGIFSLLGSRVTVVEALPQILPAEDEDAAALVRQDFDRRGIEVAVGAKVLSIDHAGEGVRVRLGDGRSFEAAQAVVSIGRSLNTAGLGLERAGLAPDARGAVPVDGFMETPVPGIHAVGDITGKAQLAHVASAQAAVLAERLAGGRRAMDYAAVPYAVFTRPEVATVGMNERAAAKAGRPFLKGKAPLTGNLKARIDMDQTGFIKIIVDAGDRRIIGGTIVGPKASEMIHTVAAAVRSGLTAEEFAHGIYLHPSLSESFHDAAGNVPR